MYATWKRQELTLVSYAEGLYGIFSDKCPEPACAFGPEEAATAWRKAMVDCEFFGTCPEDMSSAGSNFVLLGLLLASAFALLRVNGR